MNNTKNEDLLLNNYDYFLPPHLIATHPIYPKDEAKLLIYDRTKDDITHTKIKYINDFLPPCHIVFNDTKVIKARIYGHKANQNKKIEVFYHHSIDDFTHLVQIKARVKLHDNIVFENDLKATIIALKDDGTRIVSFYNKDKCINKAELLAYFETYGHVPLPPYIKRIDKAQDNIDYQSIFANKLGAIAAPTASLHFTKALINVLKSSHHIHTLTLHVGAGTFRPVVSENIKDHIMHKEYFSILPTLANIINSEARILAIGTTVARSIEYFHRTGISCGDNDIFLHPFNPPKRIDHLLTNFHLPKSSLIMLVASMIGRKTTLKIYDIAIKNSYRFYSYGDAMLIL